MMQRRFTGGWPAFYGQVGATSPLLCIKVGIVTERSEFMMAALTSATMPNAAIAGARASEQTNPTDEGYGVDHAVVQDAAGKLYDVFASNTPEGRKRLAGRVRAAQTLAQARELGGLGFAVDRIVAFSNGDLKHSSTGDTSVLVAIHHVGQARPLELLTLDDCSSVGTALGAIHRLRPDFLQEAGYPTFATGQIRAQLTAWIKRLCQAGHVPQEITTSWANILETDGLWSFSTCPVHGGLRDGDLLFSGSSITAVTNWQDMQVNDPARDLAWIFAKLDENHRNALLSAYGRMLGNRLDDLIMLRANLWLQMEQVGDFISALNKADNAKIMQFKAQVERLAHQLDVTTAKNRAQTKPKQEAKDRPQRPPSTITVGTLLNESERRRNAAAQQNDSDTTGERHIDAVNMDDSTGDFDATDSQPVRKTKEIVNDATEAFVPAGTQQSQAPSDSTNEREATSVSTFIPERSAKERHESMPSSSTMVISRLETADGNDDTNEESIPASHSEAATVLIPLLERDEATMQKAQAQINRWETEDATDEKPRVE